MPFRARPSQAATYYREGQRDGRFRDFWPWGLGLDDAQLAAIGRIECPGGSRPHLKEREDQI
jgi:hypothetical protein